MEECVARTRLCSGARLCVFIHSLQQCQQFKQMKHRDKLSFLKEKELCFGCLCAGHRSRNCEGRSTCRTCGQRHPTVLHINRRETANAPSEPAKESGGQVLTASLKTSGHTGAGRDRCLLPILPVQVKSVTVVPVHTKS